MTLREKATIFRHQCDVMDATRKNKRYGRDSVAFERRWASQLYSDTQARLERTFRIEENFAFLTPIPRWREIFATCASGRNADHELCDALEPYIERELHERTFNNRIGMGSQAAINRVMEDVFEVTQGYTRPARIIKLDLKGFFPNANLDVMEQFFLRIIDKYQDGIIANAVMSGACPPAYAAEYPAYLRWLAMVVIHCCPTRHCELRTPRALWHENIAPEKSLFGKPDGIGAPIGRLPSQKGMGLYVNDEVRWLNDDCGVRTTCFMDDFVMAVPENRHCYVLSLIPVLRQRLAAKDVRLNEKKFYDQPSQRGLEFLGSHIRNNRLHLNDCTYRRGMERLREFNSLPPREKHLHLESFLSSVNSYFGLLKNRTDHNRLMTMLRSVDTGWWHYCHYDPRRQCIVANESYGHRNLINSKHHLLTNKKIKHHDTTGKAIAA